MKKIFILFCFAVTVMAASAQSGEMELLRRQIAQYEKEIEACNTLIDKTKKDRTMSESQLKVVRTQLAKRRDMVASLNKQVGVIERDITNRNGRLGRLNRELDGLKKEYADMLYAAWKNYKHNNFMLFLFSAADFNAASRRADFMRRYNRARQEKAGRIVALSDSIRGEVRKLDATRLDLDATRQTHSKEATTLAGDEKQYKTRVDNLSAEQKNLQKQLAEKEAQRRKAQSQIDELIAAEIRRSQGVAVSDADARALAELSGRFEDNRGRLPYPIAGGVIIDRFGEHAHLFNPSVSNNNKGVNIAGTGGAAVRCVFEGKVQAIFEIRGLNRCVLVRHGSYMTVYANLVSVSVRTGDEVSAGRTLGRIDSGSDPDNNYLHFEIRREADGTEPPPQNPEQWLRR